MSIEEEIFRKRSIKKDELDPKIRTKKKNTSKLCELDPKIRTKKKNTSKLW